MRKDGYTTVELAILLGVFSVAYFTVAIIISNNFKVSFSDDLYEQKIDSIEDQAIIYAKGQEELFAEDKTVYITIEQLANANAIISSEEGKVVDPRNSENNLNDLKVKITKDGDNITAQVLA